jgi:hypothetical protein
MTRFATILFSLVLVSTAAAQADHLQCFKVKDSVTKTTYTADLTPADGAFPVAPGCIVRLPAKMLCIDVQKTNVTPMPPGAAPGAPGQKYLCYKVKCPKVPGTAALQDQFGSHSLTYKATSLVCAPVPAPTTTTTTTTSTTTTTLGCTPTGPEVCDGMDNDCNGMVDDGLGQTSCGTGACQNTVQNCVMGMPQSCTPGTPSTEICGNTIDDDCDGQVDEQPCNCTLNSQCPGAANASGSCQGGMCTIVCNAGFANCNGNNIDGCEIALNSDPDNCGGCGLSCPNRPNATRTCTGAMCGIVCNAPFLNCNGNNTDGCEINPTSDPANCGACGVVCPVSNPNCVSSTCQ